MSQFSCVISWIHLSTVGHSRLHSSSICTHSVQHDWRVNYTCSDVNAEVLLAVKGTRCGDAHKDDEFMCQSVNDPSENRANPSSPSQKKTLAYSPAVTQLFFPLLTVCCGRNANEFSSKLHPPVHLQNFKSFFDSLILKNQENPSNFCTI